MGLGRFEGGEEAAIVGGGVVEEEKGVNEGESRKEKGKIKEKKVKNKRGNLVILLLKKESRVPRNNLPQIRGPILLFLKTQGNFCNSM